MNTINAPLQEHMFNQELVDKIESCINDLYNFYQKFVASSYQYNVPAPHIQELAGYLTSVYRGELNRLCVAMPPRHSKSSMITIAFPLWLIFRNPNTKILIVSAESGLSEKFGIQLREYIKKYGGWFNVYLSDVKHSSTHLMFEDATSNLYQGSIRLVGSNGSITGQDADYLIIDDPYKGTEINPTLLTKKIEWFKLMILQRLEMHSKLLILHTRWATGDLIGYLKENHNTDYEFIEYPAIKDDGTPLWVERYSIEFLQNQMQTMGERLFNSIFQQRPLNEGGVYFDIDKIQFDDKPYRPTGTYYAVRSYDLAYSDASKGTINDSTAGVLMLLTGNRFIVTDIVYGQFGNNLKEVIKSTAMRDTSNIPILLETGTVGGAAEFLFNEYKNYLQGYNCIQSKPIGSKVDRSFGFQQAVLDGKIQINIPDASIRNELINQLKTFPYDAKHDDIIDAISYAYNYLEKYARPSIIATTDTRLQDNRIRIGGHINGSTNPAPYRNRRRRRWNFK